MTCPVCPAAGWAGGWLGSYIGINPPQHRLGKFVSALITATLTLVTIVALKIIFNTTLCVGGTFTLENCVRVGLPALALGIVYSIGVNYLLNRFVFPPTNLSTPPAQEIESSSEDSLPPCCCQKKN